METLAEIKNKSISKMGAVNYISIPKKLFDTGVLDNEKEYRIVICEEDDE